MGRKGKSAPPRAGWKRPVAGILLAGGALLLLLGLSSYRPRASAPTRAGPVARDLGALHAAKGGARLGVAGGALAVRGAAAAIAKARTVSVGDAPLEADEDARIVEASSRRSVGRKAIELADEAADEPPQDPREPVIVSEKPPRKTAAAQECQTPLIESESGGGWEPPLVHVEKTPPQIVEPKAPPRPHAPKALEPQPVEPGTFTMAPGHAAFVPPPITILTGEASQALPLDREGLTATAEKLRQKLASFGIQGQVTQIRPGPVVTMFEFLPAAGIKVSRIASLASDLATSIASLPVPLFPPTPTTSTV